MSSENTAQAVRLLTKKDAAYMLNVCVRSLERLIAGGDFPQPVKIGRSSRVLESDVRSYLEKLIQKRGQP